MSEKDNRNKPRRVRFSERVSKFLGLPAEVYSDGCGLELCGRHELVVHGCRKILAYSDCEIKLGMKEYILTVGGSGLICISYLSGSVGIRGYIDCISFEDRKGGERV